MQATARLRDAALLGQIKSEPGEYRIAIPGYPAVSLRPVSTVRPAPEDVARLTEWRNRHVRSFLTEFDATPSRTEKWLTTAIAADGSRILFMIDEAGAGPLGYIGLASIDWSRRSAEPDSVVRGRPGHPGVMSAAMTALLDWARKDLGLEIFELRVLADNPANEFYQRFGFRERTRVGLRRDESPGLIAWKEAPPGAAHDGRFLIHYVLSAAS